VAKSEWGSKRVCLNCGAKFYDLNRTPIVCPACQAAFDPAGNSKPRRSRTPVKAPAAAAPAAKVTVIEREEVETEDEEIAASEDEEIAVAEDDTEDENESESAIEDVSELGDDDMSDVIDAEIDEDDSER